MEDGALKKNTIFTTTSGTFTDLNFTDELLVQGYWCKRTGVNIFEPEPSISSVLHDPSPYLPFMGSGHFSINTHHISLSLSLSLSIKILVN
jgi:hypothetical protein